jgi:O-methyltransferase
MNIMSGLMNGANKLKIPEVDPITKNTRDAIIYCEKNNIEGSWVECGIMEGQQPRTTCFTILKNNFKIRDIYMYDTFSGLPEPGEHDFSNSLNREELLKIWVSMKTGDNTNAFCYCSLEQAKKYVNSTNYPQDKLHFIKGDVLETLNKKENIPDKICILRLDTDWYDSSKYELEKLYNNVVDGGIVILDDYFEWNGQRKATDEFFKENNINKKIIQVNDHCGYFIK